ncbi:MAG: GNAT family N-acetyltransferase [Friedmanniella sp.]
MTEHDPLRHAALGQRWVVRRRLPDGSATDVIGWLDALTAEYLQLGTPDGLVHVVERADVVLARRAPAAAGGPPPDRTSAEELERHALRGWLALHEPLGEWTLRAGGGFTGRANSCHAVGDPGMPAADAAQRIQDFAAAHGIEPRAQVVRGSEPEVALRALGWVDGYVPTDVLAVRLADFLGSTPSPPQVRVTEELEVPWWNAYGESRPNDADPALLRLILAGNPPRAFASAGDREAPFAIGRGHLSGDWLGYASLWTRPQHRREGWASAIMTALGHWAARRGARYAYLQVASANQDAIAAYARLGFRRHHSYLYLVPG